MAALDTKLVREAWKLRGQMLSIGAVVAVGIMTVLTMRGTYESLVTSQARYYRDARFPDVWANLERAPESLLARIAEVPGVAATASRVSFTSTLDVPGLDAPGRGLLVSIPPSGRPALSDLTITSGRYPASDRRDEVVVSKNFALANAFVPGDTLSALVNGRLRDLRIVGTAIAPEHIYTVPPGALYPDNQRFGIVWMGRESLAAAYDMDGAFNEVMIRLAPGASEAHVLAELDRLLEPFGGLGAYPRAEQASHAILQGELDSNRATGTIVPAIFLLVAAFLLNIVLGRLIATQRTEIAVLKAFGYTDLEVGAHYLQFAFVAIAGGALVGVALGIWLGGGMVELYKEFFDFPDLRFQTSWELIGIAFAVSALAAVLGALGAVRRAVRLPPAEAMRPEPPASFRPGALEKMGLHGLLPAAARMILRNVERTPIRSALSALGVAFATAILVVGLFMFDAVQHMMDLQFRVSQRESLALTFTRPLSDRVRHELDRLDGVTRVEPFRGMPVRLRAGHREMETAVSGFGLDTELRRPASMDGTIHPIPEEGLLLSAYVADRLRVRRGDTIEVESLEGKRRAGRLPVAGVVDDAMGAYAYMDLQALTRFAGGAASFSGAFLSVDDDRTPALSSQLKRLPSVAAVASPDQMLASFEQQLEEGLFISMFFMLGFSGVIAVAVIYNGARVSLSERGRELASLRVLGFSRPEVAVLLLGEQGLTTVLGIPIGWVLGYGLAALVTAGIQTEAYRIPLVVNPGTFAWATAATLAAAVLSGLLVRRRLYHLNLIEVLKTRE